MLEGLLRDFGPLGLIGAVIIVGMFGAAMAGVFNKPNGTPTGGSSSSTSTTSESSSPKEGE